MSGIKSKTYDKFLLKTLVKLKRNTKKAYLYTYIKLEVFVEPHGYCLVWYSTILQTYFKIKTVPIT